ncbi:MAG: putative bifunctional diguanylate cyclase/phosphodiesterase, partial [Acidobacteriota bacterium]
MRCPSVVADESDRLLALAEYGLDENEVLPDLEPVVHIAARMLDMPVAAVNMIGSDHVFFAASVGIGECDMRRDVSFCAHAITQNEVMVVPDATLDPRFHDNPLVTGSAGIRFYAGIPLRSPSGHALGALCVIDSRPHSSFSEQDRQRLKDLGRLASDKLELRRLENARSHRSFRFEDIAITSPTPIVCLDEERTIRFWNAPAAAMFGYSLAEGVGMPFERVVPAGDDPLMRMIEKFICSGQPSVGGSVQEAQAVRRDGSAFPIEISLFCWSQEGRRHFGAMLSDISDRRHREDQLFQLANFDDLTGAANRSLFQRRADEELASGHPTAVLALDLDNFKDINDTLGCSCGDRVLAAVASRILSRIRPTDTLARIGGDEFALLLPQSGDAHRALSVAEAVIAAIGRPLQLDAHEVRVAACCGIAISPVHGRTTEELMGNADLALYQAKATGRGCSSVFVPSLRREAIERRNCHAELPRALEAGEFELFYQPQIRIADGTTVGAEALIRWNHPRQGRLSPAAFLPALEGGTLAAAVGRWVLETAFSQLASWRSEGSSLRMGVNLFAAQLRTAEFDAQVADLLRRCNL